VNEENDHEYFRCVIVMDRPTAYLLYLESSKKEVWVPKSLCDLKGGRDGTVVEVESWYAKKENWDG